MSNITAQQKLINRSFLPSIANGPKHSEVRVRANVVMAWNEEQTSVDLQAYLADGGFGECRSVLLVRAEDYSSAKNPLAVPVQIVEI